MGTKKTSKTAKPTQRKKPSTTKQPWLRGWRAWILGAIGVVVALVVLVVITFQVSPWPGSLFIRYEFDKGGKKTEAALQKHVPGGVDSVLNQQYKVGDKDAKLDVYYPSSAAITNKALPTVVWVHGGAWVSGSKENVAPYLKILASSGYTVVGIDYSIAPEKKYPTPVLQTNEALKYVQQNAARLHIDPQQFVLAGDSAGSQIAAQVAAMISDNTYAQAVGISSPISRSQLKAVVLNCGAYDMTLPNYNGPDGKFLKTVLWAYTGTQDFLHDPSSKHASVADYVNKNFPPAFITAGNVDPLESQSREFAGKLTQLGVPTSTLFYTKNHQPELQHEYQFNLDISDGQQALQRILAFLHIYTSS
jgi:acetyl esterase/lipase